MIDLIAEHLALIMLVAFAVLLFSGYPVALILTGVGLAFTFFGLLLGEFPAAAVYYIPPLVDCAIFHGFVDPAFPIPLFMGNAEGTSLG